MKCRMIVIMDSLLVSNGLFTQSLNHCKDFFSTIHDLSHEELFQMMFHLLKSVFVCVTHPVSELGKSPGEIEVCQAKGEVRNRKKDLPSRVYTRWKYGRLKGKLEEKRR